MLSLTHITIKTNCPQSNIDWEAVARKLVAELRLTVIEAKFHYFKPFGVTGYLLLQESHLSLHSWPEEDTVIFDILSCRNLLPDFESRVKAALIGITIKELKVDGTLLQVARPRPKREYDQFYATSETAAKRIAKFAGRDDLRGRRVLFLGDDDLGSIAVAQTKLAAEVVVLDIDNDILGVIQKTAQDEKLKIKVQKYDARLPLPREFASHFDVVFSDPPYTPSGLGTFLSRLVAASTKDADIYICYGYTQKELERPLKIQKLISDWGLLIAEKLEDFNEYTGAKSINNRSSLYILKKTPQTRVNEKLLQGGFYTNN